MKTLAPLLFALAMVIGCGGDDDGHTHCHTEDCAPTPDAPVDPDAPVTPPGEVQEVACEGATVAETIAAPGFAFEPETVTISAGDIIRFTMPGSHSAVSGTPASPTDDFVIGFNQTKCFKFTVAATYPFYCNPHEFAGTITVQ